MRAPCQVLPGSGASASVGSFALLDWISSNRKKSLLALFLCAAFAHSAGLFGRFLDWDDALYVRDQKRIHALTPENVREILDPRLTESDPFPEFQPARDFSLALDHAVWGENPFGYHLTNLLLHATNAVLVALVLLGLFGSYPAAWLTAMVFAVHPVHVESVAWISSRKDVLGLFFMLLSALFFLRNGRLRWAASLGFLVLALLSKSQVVMLPVLLGLCLLGRGEGRRLVRLLPHVLVVLLYVANFLHMQFVRTPVESFYARGFEPHAGAIVRVFAQYAWNVLSPVGLSPYYDWTAGLKQFNADFWLSLLWTVAYAAGVSVAWRRWRPVGLSLAFFAVQLLPVLNLLPHPISGRGPLSLLLRSVSRVAPGVLVHAGGCAPEEMG